MFRHEARIKTGPRSRFENRVERCEEGGQIRSRGKAEFSCVPGLQKFLMRRLQTIILKAVPFMRKGQIGQRLPGMMARLAGPIRHPMLSAELGEVNLQCLGGKHRQAIDDRIPTL